MVKTENNILCDNIQTDIILFDSRNRKYTYEDYIIECEKYNCIPCDKYSMDFLEFKNTLICKEYDNFLHGYITDEINENNNIFILHGYILKQNNKFNIEPEINDKIDTLLKISIDLKYDNHIIIKYNLIDNLIKIVEYQYNSYSEFIINSLKQSILTNYIIKKYIKEEFIFQKTEPFKFINILEKNNLIDKIKFNYNIILTNIFFTVNRR